MRKKKTRIITVLVFILMVISLMPISRLTVEAAVKPKLAKKYSNIVVGGTAQVKVKNAPKGAKITYKSAKRRIATVSKTGRVKGIKNGKTKITVIIKKKQQIKKLSYKVTVKKPSISKNVVALTLGDTVKLSIKNKPKKASYIWSSGNPGIATVSQNGTVTANSEGIVTINTKVKTAKKIYRLSCIVTVSSDSNMSIFKQLPQEFIFASGIGAWSTGIDLNPDGTFTGKFHDMERGSTGNKYPHGTIYICSFNGKFTVPEQIDEYIYLMKLEYLNVEGTPGNEYYENDMRFIYSEPYGFEDADEFYIYLPGCPLEKTLEEFISGSFINAEIGETIPIGVYGIYNAGGRHGFIGRSENAIWDKE